jgi:hypothetical protein
MGRPIQDLMHAYFVHYMYESSGTSCFKKYQWWFFDSTVRVDIVNKIVCHPCYMTRGIYSPYSTVTDIFYMLVSSKDISNHRDQADWLWMLSPLKLSWSRNSEQATKYFRNPKYFGLQLFQMLPPSQLCTTVGPGYFFIMSAFEKIPTNDIIVCHIVAKKIVVQFGIFA